MSSTTRFAGVRLTVGYLRDSLHKQLVTAVPLGLVAVLLGVAPTVQSAVESNILNTLARASSPDPDTGMPPVGSLWQLMTGWEVAIPGPSQFSPTGSISSGTVVPLGWALLIYVGVVAAVILLEVTSARLSSKIVRGYFVFLQRQGWKGALHATPGLERRLSEARRAELNRGPVDASSRNDDEVESLSGYWSRAIQEGAEAVSFTVVRVFDLLRSAVTFATATVLIFQLGFAVLLAFLVVILLTSLLSWLQSRRLRESRQRLESESATLSGRMNDALAHRDLIRAWEQADRVETQIDQDADRLVRVEQGLAVSAANYRETGRAIFDIGRIAALVCFVIFVGVQRDSVVDVFLVSTLYFRLLGPVQQLTRWIDYWARTRATTQIFAAVLQEQPPTRPAQGITPFGTAQTGPVIEFDQVFFSYPRVGGDVRRVFDNLSLAIPRGKATLLVGRSGSGKTTLSRMMMGFIAPTNGAVRVEGTDINAGVDKGELLKRFSYVAQGHNVLHGTVRENLFHPTGPDPLLEEKLNQVRLGHVMLDDSATNLSTGQQQRLALARLLLSDAEIFVLDEPTTGLDAFTMHELMPVLKELLFSGKTVIMITHRLIFAEQFDHVVMLLDGSGIETGSPASLLANRNSQFRALYDFAHAELKGNSA